MWEQFCYVEAEHSACIGISETVTELPTQGLGLNDHPLGLPFAYVTSSLNFLFEDYCEEEFEFK